MNSQLQGQLDNALRTLVERRQNGRLREQDAREQFLLLESTYRFAQPAITSLRAAANELNDLTSIARLPDELLCHIFSLLYAWPSLQPAVHVCRHWRSTALGDPLLWTTLVGKTWQQVTVAIPALIPRSRDAPLHLVLQIPWPHALSNGFESLREALRRNVHRIHSLHVTAQVWDQMMLILGRVCGALNADKLRELELFVPANIGEMTLGPFIGFAHVEKLVTNLLPAGEWTRNLKSLEFAMTIYAHELIEVLRNTPVLKRLVLRNALTTDRSGWDFTEGLGTQHAPKLDVLEFRDAAYTWTDCLELLPELLSATNIHSAGLCDRHLNFLLPKSAKVEGLYVKWSPRATENIHLALSIMDGPETNLKRRLSFHTHESNLAAWATWFGRLERVAIHERHWNNLRPHLLAVGTANLRSVVLEVPCHARYRVKDSLTGTEQHVIWSGHSPFATTPMLIPAPALKEIVLVQATVPPAIIHPRIALNHLQQFEVDSDTDCRPTLRLVNIRMVAEDDDGREALEQMQKMYVKDIVEEVAEVEVDRFRLPNYAFDS